MSTVHKAAAAGESIGVPLVLGLQRLSALGRRISWIGRSPVLVAACQSLVSDFGFQPFPPGVSRPRIASGEIGLAYRPDPAVQAWAAANGISLALPPGDVVDAAGNKARLLGLARVAGVTTPSATVLDRATEDAAAVLWPPANGALVAQLLDDDLTGAGTRLVESAAELRACLAAWRCRPVKVAELVTGLPLTVSGCVGRESVLVSGVSHQLVGYPRLTSLWGRHCGNQLVGDAELPQGAGSGCRRACLALGRALRDTGFRGMFGVDLVATAGGVVAIEINPRIQSVSSLLAWDEARSGFLPLPFAHLLEFAGRLPEPVVAGSAGTCLSQVVLYARDGGSVHEPLPAGRYVLGRGGMRPAPRDVIDLPSLGPEEALVWPFVAGGDQFEAGERLAILQFARRVAPVDGGRQLHEWTEPWLAAVESKLGAR
ncbi:MAG: ATP-grasp domain-containing protein [Gaiellaceae bacterium]